MGHRTTRPHAALAAYRIRRLVVVALAPVLAQTGPAQVDRVIDGDTISVRRDGASFHCRECSQLETTARAARGGRWADPERS